jgi:hypothetical protein
MKLETNMKTYEGVMTIKWYKNDNGGDRRPLTIDTQNKETLRAELSRIKKDFMTKGEVKDTLDERGMRITKAVLPYSINIEVTERL